MRIWWLVLGAGLLAPLVVAPYPPLYDYYNWAFQGKILGSLLLDAAPGRAAVDSLYGLRLQPIPNLAAPLGMALLNGVFGPFEAARAFVALSALAFAAAFGYLARVVHGRPTAVEVVACAWALGYFVTRGYISFLLGLALGLFLIARLLRMLRDHGETVRPGELALLTVLGVLTYLCHLFGWLIAMAGLAACVIWLVRQAQLRDAVRIAATSVPTVLLLGWYVLARQGSGALVLYQSLLRDKVLSLEPLILFLRPDPFLPPLPAFWMNVGLGALLAAAVAVNVGGLRRDRLAAPVLLSAAFLWLGYAVLPFAEIGSSDLNSIIKPDERFALPALLLTLLLLRARDATGWRTHALGAVVLGVLVYHTVEYVRFSGAASGIEQLNAQMIPVSERVFSVVVHEAETSGACSNFSGPSIGPPTLKWFDQVYAARTSQLRTDLLDTGVLFPRFSPDQRDVAVLKITSGEIQTGALSAQALAGYPFVEAFGCQRDLEAVGQALGTAYHLVGSVPGAALFNRAAS